MTKGIALTADDATPTLDQVFEVLRLAAASADAREGALYGAQAKKYLIGAFPGFTERDYGFRKFVDLLRAGNEQGHFRLEITEDGHPRLTTATTAVSTTTLPSPVWLKPDLWSAMLTWDRGERHWDRKHGRAIFVPTNDTGTPLWEVSPDDFADIEPVSMEQHLDWMRTFAGSQPQSVATALREALSDPAPGAFKRRLAKLRLQGAWTAYLRQRLTEHASSWAGRNGIPVGTIVEVRAKSPSAPASSKAAPSKPEPSSVPGAEEADDLRSRLHRIVDQMSLAELAALPIPAGYLVAR